MSENGYNNDETEDKNDEPESDPWTSEVGHCSPKDIFKGKHKGGEHYEDQVKYSTAFTTKYISYTIESTAPSKKESFLANNKFDFYLGKRLSTVHTRHSGKTQERLRS